MVINAIFVRPLQSINLSDSFPRRRFKRRRGFSLRSDLTPFGDLLTPNSIALLAPAIGLASGLALFASRLGSVRPSVSRDVGEWILFTSPTPFNRFVLLRCRSISFEGGELLGGLNERLVKEDKHFVRLDSGRVCAEPGFADGLGRKLEYQRVCVSADDGGVVSLDWPAELDLADEHGLDTTVLIVPGSAEGSMDDEIQSFVCEALRRGFFPVVMNPRGCAGSPITTPRLFTAADSDDIGTAIRFINKGRPWTTLMGVGWGYGANMLTKYLAEVGEATPLIAVTCIDNPFDLEEATSISPHHIAVDQKLTGGLVDILRSNKELFRGRGKEFDVDKALSAKSLRDFEKAISMVSYGFEVVEDFYSISSTRNLIGDLKNDDGSAPPFSIPRNSIAENPFTSLLLCSRLLSTGTYGCRSAIAWCQQLTLEWLAAVELGLLKGRHPLLEDVDITINPSNGLAFMDRKLSKNTSKITKLSNRTSLSSSRGYTKNPANDMLNESDTSLVLRSRKELLRKYDAEDRGLQRVESGPSEKMISADTELVEQEDDSSIPTETGEMLQTAQVVMNMLDVTLPGTVTEEKKKKVLAAVDQGETLIKALQDAVPDDVRGKLTTAVSGILSSQNTQLKIKQLLRVSQIRASGSKSKTEEKVGNISNTEVFSQGNHFSDQTEKMDNLLNQPVVQMPPGMEAEHIKSESSENSSNLGQSQSTIEGNDDSTCTTKETNDSRNGDHYDNSLKGKDIENSENVEVGLEARVKANSSSQVGNEGSAEETKSEEREDQAGESTMSEIKEDHNAKNEEKPLPDQSKMSKPGAVGENASSSGSSDVQSIEKEVTDKRQKDNMNSKPVLNDSNPPSFSVAHALDALTGMDDSTQVAVNSVFGVIEDMISQLEEGSSNENGVKNEKISLGTALTNDNATDEQKLKTSEITAGDQSVKMDVSSDSSRIHQIPVSLHGNDMKMFEQSGGTSTNEVKVAGGEKDQPSASNLLHHNSTRMKKLDDSPDYTSYTYGSFFDKEHMQNNLFSEIPTESLDSDATTALLLEYFPEEGQWKLLDQSENGSLDGNNEIKVNLKSPGKENSKDDVIEPLYAILDTEWQHDPVEELDDSMVELTRLVQKIVLDDLRIEVGRKLGSTEMEEIDSNLAKDLEQVSNAVSMFIGHAMKYALSSDVKHQDINEILQKVDTLNGENIIRVISASVQETTHLRRILPVGVIVGSSLAALSKYFNVAMVHKDDGGLNFEKPLNLVENDPNKVEVSETQRMLSQKYKNDPLDKKVGKTEPNNNRNATVMVGAVTAAIGASALVVQNQQTNRALVSSSMPSKVKSENQTEPIVEETLPENIHQNIVASLAEKAMSIASPVVPTNEDGEVDQEKLVTMLADLGQKGGILRPVGKVALLWGGIRGALSLTNKLISFLHLAERPLIQRVLAFACMVLVIWSPIVVPLLPTLVQSWSTKTTPRIAEFACIVGLYTASMILVMLWGRRIRGYENPHEQYGLDLTSLSRIQSCLIGLIGGIVLVSSIEVVNALLGCVTFSWPYSTTSSTTSLDAITFLKLYGQMLIIAGEGLVTATGVALVEELLFRSWLPEEIAADLGYHRGIIISGLLFSLLQRSPLAIPGLWLLSLSLSGIRQRSQGSLSGVIGLRAGILASSFILRRGGFLHYKPNFPLWLTGTYPFQPFSGLTGFTFSLVLALFLYPRQPMQTNGTKIDIHE